MSNVKVTYFNGRGLAEVIRLLLKYGNIDFEDNRIEQNDWPTVKPTTPFGQMPLYEENGKVMWQSLAIARYVAKKVKLVGASDWENLEIDALADTITDFRLKLVPLFTETDAEKKEKLKESLLAETAPYYLERFEKYATQNNGYLVGNKLTWVDIYFSTMVDLFNLLLGENVIEKYANLSKVKQNVNNVPAIKAWIEVRPETPF